MVLNLSFLNTTDNITLIRLVPLATWPRTALVEAAAFILLGHTGGRPLQECMSLSYHLGLSIVIDVNWY